MQILVDGTWRDEEDLKRMRGWNCDACGKRATAVADYNDRELCLACWTKTTAFRRAA